MTELNSLLRAELDKANLIDELQKLLGAELNKSRKRTKEAFAGDDKDEQITRAAYHSGITKAFDMLLTLKRDHSYKAGQQLKQSRKEEISKNR